MHTAVFIVGVPRSGTTWLWSLFKALPNVEVLVKEAGVSESGVFVRGDTVSAKLKVEQAISLSGDKVLVEKTPEHFWHMQAIKSAFPDARIVWITRDLRDAIASMMHTDHSAFRMSFDQAIAYTEFFLKKGLNQIECVTNVVSYEELASNTEKAFTNLLEELGVSYTKSDVYRAVSLNTNANAIDWNFRKGLVGSYKTDLSFEQIEYIETLFPNCRKGVL
jgi:LPS sulfotransferase NodH